MGFDYLTLFCIFSSSNRFVVHFYCTSGVQLCPGIHHEKSVFTMFLVTRCKKKTSLCLCVYGKGSFKEVLQFYQNVQKTDDPCNIRGQQDQPKVLTHFSAIILPFFVFQFYDPGHLIVQTTKHISSLIRQFSRLECVHEKHKVFLC